MRGVKTVLKSLALWIQAAASRIFELPKRRKIKRKTLVCRINNVSTFTKHITCYGDYIRSHSVRRLGNKLAEEAIIQSLITNGKFEEACCLTYIDYYVEITERCTKMLRPYVPNPEVEGEEVAQQVFLEFLRILLEGKHEPSKGSVHGFLLTIADRRAIDILRMRNRIVPGRDTDVDELDRRDLHESYASNPELMVLANEERKRVNRVNREVERLPFDDRQILHWHYTLGHSTDKIAQFTGEKRGTIASRLSRVCAKLQVVCNSDD